MTEEVIEADRPEVDVSEVPIVEDNISQEIQVEYPTNDQSESRQQRISAKPSSRHTSRGQSKRQGTSKSGRRPISAPFVAEVSYDLKGFVQRIESQASPESQFMNISDKQLLYDDRMNGVEKYLHACATIDVQPREKIITQMRDSVTDFDFSNCQLGHRGILTLSPFFMQKGEEINKLNLCGCSITTDGLVNLMSSFQKTKMAQLQEINLSSNGLEPQASLVLQPDYLLPGLPIETLEFAKEYRRQILLNRQKAIEDAKKTPEQREKEKKDKKEQENPYVDRPTALLNMGASHTRPYPPPPKTEKNSNKGPVIPELQPFSARENLTVMLNNIGMRGIDITGTCLKDLLINYKTITSIDLSNNKLGDQVIMAMLNEVSDSSLQILRLSQCNLTPDVIPNIIKYAQINQKLQLLDLSQNKLTTTCGALIGCFLAAGGAGIQDLSLEGNPLGDLGVTFVLCGANSGFTNPKKPRKTDANKGSKDVKQAPVKQTIQQLTEERNQAFQEASAKLQGFPEIVTEMWARSLGNIYVPADKAITFLTQVPQKGGRLPSLRLAHCQMSSYATIALNQILEQINNIATLDVSGNSFPALEYTQILKKLVGRENKKQDAIMISRLDYTNPVFKSDVGEADLQELEQKARSIDGIIFDE